MRILVIGCGSIGQRHARLLAERSNVELGVCDPVAANLEAAAHAAGHGEKYSNLSDALKAGFNAAIVCTPNDSHAEVSVAVMRAGLDVLVEKPMADTCTNAEAMAAVAQETGRLLMVGYVLRFHPGLREMKRLVEAGHIGQLVGARAMIGTYFTLMCARTPFRLTQRGVLVLDYTHLVDYLGWFLGSVAEVAARAARTGDLPMRPDPNLVAALLRYRSGAIATLHLDYIQHPQRHVLDLYGDKGTLVMNFETALLEEYKANEEGVRVRAIPYFRDNMFREEHSAFLESLRTRVPVISAADGIEAMRVAEAILTSATFGGVVQLPG